MSSHRGDRHESRTLVELLRARAELRGDALLYRYLRAGEIDGPLDEWTYSDVDRRARAVAVAAGECSRRGERALLLYPPGLDFVAGFFGCLYAGIVAVPLYPPDPSLRESSVRRLFAVADDARPSLVLTTGELMRALRPRLAGLAHLPWVATDEMPLDGAAAWCPFDPSSDDLAFLQYTSGSTGDPKGVMLSHRNILANAAMLGRAWECDERTPLVSWLPLFHDMGLITQVILSLYAGSNVTLMSPLHFVQRPVRWLRAISHYRAEISGGPNFAYDLCAQKTTADERGGLELGRWRVAFNGAEPVRAATLRRFTDVFAPHGFHQRQLGPCYGLAEATVFVSAPLLGTGPTTLSVDELALSEHRVVPAVGPGARELVASGEGWLDEQIVIVDPETLVPCAADRVGEIWVSGPHVGRGYWGRPELSEQVFRARLAGAGEVSFLRTGDLGFLRDGQLFVTGRRKDILIVRGRNHYPQDIELTVEASHPRVRPGCSAVFALEGEERIVVVAEVDMSKGELDFAAVCRDLRAAVADEHEIGLHAIALLEARSVPKTSSGKIQRRGCRADFTSGGLRELHRAVFSAPESGAEPGGDPAAMPAGAAGVWLVRQLAERLGVPPGEVDVRRPFRQLGLDSKDVVALSGELSRVLGVPLSPTIFYDHPTVADVVRHLEGTGAAPRGPRSAAPDEPIALIGLGCRFPGGVDDAASYWGLLSEGRSAISEVPADRWDVEALHDPTPGVAGRMYVRKGGFIGDVAGFDAAFFDIAPREARSMDPQQRLLLEVAYEALDDAGQPQERLAGSRTGVFVGVSSNDYGLRALHPVDPRHIDGYAGTGNAASVAAGRISYLLGLEGPSLAVDTACSSSLVAVHLACQSLRAGECDLALAGGVNLLLSPDVTIFFCQLRALAPDGQCKPFDAAADGFVRSEGCGVVALKRLADAVRDGDRVLCVIRGTAVNQDGRSNGLAAPNGRAQQACVREALARGGMRPADVDYVEAHGTGTRLGDPVEVRALAAALGPGRAADAPLLVGSVKANLGHCEAAAGVAGLIKVALMLRHGAVPAQLHVDTPNPLIPWSQVPVRVATKAQAWMRGSRPRIAGVSSFGISGTNAHVIVEEAPPEPAVDAADAQPLLLPLSARCPAALRAMVGAYRELLTRDAVGSIVYTAAVRRTQHPHRLAVVGRSAAALAEALDAVLAGAAHPGVCEGRAGSGRPRVVLVFPGQGSQWAGMGRQLFAEQPVFRDAIAACDAAMRPHTDWSLVDVLADPSGEALGRIDVVQPVLLAIEVGLAALWRSWGVVPDVVVGHSMGEVAAAHVAGALTLDDAARIICRRSRLLRTVSGQGAMALVELPDDEVARRLGPYRAAVSVAISNSARSTVFSGATAAVEELVLRFQAEGVFCRRINVDVASHGPQMDTLAGDLLRELAGVSPRRASVPMYSTVDAELSDGQSFDAAYWVRNLREPVRFARAIEALSRDGDVVFVEVSPHPILSPAIEETARATRPAVVASLRREQDESVTMLGSLARLFCAGVAVDLRRLAPAGARCVALPRYPWQRVRHWLDDDAGAPAAAPRRGEPTRHPLLGRVLRSSVEPSTRYWESTLRLEDVPYVTDHRVQDVPVMPAAAFLEMALAAGRAALGGWPGGLRDVAFVAPLQLEPGRARILQLVLSAPTADALAGFRIASAAEGDDGAWTLHATGQVEPATTEMPLAGASSEPHWRDGEATAEGFYAALAERGLAYGSCFQGVRSLAWAPRRASAFVQAPPALAAEVHTYGLHPAILDACLQVIAAAAVTGLSAEPAIPVALERIRVFEPQGLQQGWCEAHAERQDGDILGGVTLRDSDGRARVEVVGLRARPLAAVTGRGPACLGLEWRPDAGAREIAEEAPGDGAWLLLGDWAGVGDRLRAGLERRGHAVVTVHEGARDFDPGSPAAFEGLLRDSFGRHRRCRGVVHLWGLDALDDDATTGADVLGSCGAALHLVQALARMGWRDPPRLWFVTQGAQAIGTSLAATPVAAAQAPLWGLANALRYEHPELGCACIDLSPTEGPDEAAAALVHELLASDDEELIARRDGQRHVGRLTRRYAEANRAHALPEAQLVRPDGAYLITGGLGGLGLSLAAWLVRQGARHLMLVGRRGAATPGAEQALAELRDAGAEVTVVQADVASRDELARALVMLETRGPILRGVVHAAGLLDDGLLVTQDLARLARVLRPKVDGALNLHLLTQGQSLDFFVLYSSAAALLGSPGQGPYAAANAFLDALAHRRRGLGLPALSVNWGPFSDVGLAAEGGRASRLGERGVRALAAAEGEALLGRLLALGATQAAPVALDVRQWLDCNPQVAASAQLSELIRDMGASRGSLVASLRELDPRERRRSLEQLLHQQAAAVLRTDLARVALDRPLQGLGLDSLTSLELRNRIEAATGLTLPAIVLWTHPTIVALARHLASELDGGVMPVASRPAPPTLELDVELDLEDTASLLAAAERELRLASE